MATSRTRARASKAAGRVEEAAGELLDDAEMTTRGQARQIDAALQDLCGQACEQVKGAACDLARSVQRNPITAVATAGLVGMLVGMLMRRD